MFLIVHVEPLKKEDIITNRIVSVRPCNLEEDVPGEVYKRECPFKALLAVTIAPDVKVYPCHYDIDDGYCGHRGEEIDITIIVEE